MDNDEVLLKLDAVHQDEEAAREAEQHARSYALSTTPGEHIRPRDLQSVTKGGISFNAACSVLEALEKDGELARTSRPEYAGMMVWMRASTPSAPGPGYALPLSQREHGALLRALDWMTGHIPVWLNDAPQGDLTTLRAIRSRLKGGPL